MKRWRIALILAACFLFRLFFGLSREFFFEDQTQIFLLGFRYYATAAWPFFGPDVVWTRSEIPGALQALLIGLPLRLLPIPEAPFVLLNLLSFAAICALALGMRVRAAASRAALAGVGLVPDDAVDDPVLGAHDQHVVHFGAVDTIFSRLLRSRAGVQPAARAGAAGVRGHGRRHRLADADSHVVAAAAPLRRPRVAEPPNRRRRRHGRQRGGPRRAARFCLGALLLLGDAGALRLQHRDRAACSAICTRTG